MRVLNGKPFNCYVPSPMYKMAQIRPYVTQFRKIEQTFEKLDQEASSFNRLLSSAASGSALNGGVVTVEEGERFTEAVAYLRKIKIIRAEHLPLAHRLLTDIVGNEFRQDHVWLNGTHPSMSWFVGPPPEMVKKLASQCLQVLDDKELASSLRASVCMVRLMQIHPFLDANGRLARAVFCAHALNSRVSVELFLPYLQRLWLNGGHWLATQLNLLQNTENWNDILEFAMSAMHENSVSHPTINN